MNWLGGVWEKEREGRSVNGLGIVRKGTVRRENMKRIINIIKRKRIITGSIDKRIDPRVMMMIGTAGSRLPGQGAGLGQFRKRIIGLGQGMRITGSADVPCGQTDVSATVKVKSQSQPLTEN